MHEYRESGIAHPQSVDRTFTFRSHIFERKSKNRSGEWTPATMLGLTIIQEGKEEQTYRAGFRHIAERCSLEDTPCKIITDGEPGLINACDVFKKAKLYRDALAITTTTV